MSYYYAVMRQLGDMGKRGNFDFVPTLLKNEILSLLDIKDVANKTYLVYV